MSITELLKSKADLHGITNDVTTKHPFIITSGDDVYVRVWSYPTFWLVVAHVKKFGTWPLDLVTLTHWDWYKVVGERLVKVKLEELQS